MSNRIGMALACWVSVWAVCARAEDWPQFRGPTGQGVSAATGLPVSWGPSKNVAWKADVAGAGWSSPVLVAGRLYLTTAVEDGNGASLRVVSFDAADGKVVWDVEALRADATAVKAKHQKNSPASATPVVEGNRIYAHFGHMGTAALDLSGKVAWRQTSIKYPPVHGNGGSPALVDVGGKKVLVFTCDGARDPFVAALDAGTGKIQWRTPRNTAAKSKFSFSTPLPVEIEGMTQLVIPGSGFVGGYEPGSGRELWRVGYGEGYSVVPRPVYSAELGLVFVSSGFNQPVVYAIRPAGAKGDVSRSAVAWTIRRDGPKTPSMLNMATELYFVSDNGVATCADAASGRVHWSHRFGGGFSASPVGAEGKVYFQNEAGVGYVVRAGKQFELMGENDLGERSLASYAVGEGALFIRTEGHLWKIAERRDR